MAEPHRTLNRKARKHGQSRKGKTTHEYWIWAAMIQRCTNPKNAHYADYGGRGIRVCERWMTFVNFFADMGQRPTPRHQLDRRDNNGGYDPENCRWATGNEQCRNTRRNRVLTHNGLALPVAVWAERLGWHQNVLHDRLRLGWSVEEALTTPRKSRGASSR